MAARGPQAQLSYFLETALEAVRIAERIALRYWQRPSRARLKADGSPVTAADTGIERAATKLIRSRFPDHAILGEEYGRRGSSGEYLWLIDPIDGTKNFAGKIPLWGTLIGLRYLDKIIIGVSHMPLMRETLWAATGRGARLNGKKVRVSNVRRLDQAMISFGSPGGFAKLGKEKQLLQLVTACKRQRCFGDQYPYHLVGSGRIEIALEAMIKPVDIAPFVVIIPEAGGEVSDLQGRPFSLDISSFMATNGTLQQSVLHAMKLHSVPPIVTDEIAK